MILRLSNPNDTRDLKSANLNEYLDMIYRLKSKVQNRTILQSKIKSFHRLYQTRTSIQLTLPLLKQANEYDDITNFLNCFPKEQFQTLIINYNSLVEYPLESLKIINFISTIFNSIHSVYMNSFPRDKTFEIIPYLSRLPIKKLHHSHSLGDQDIKEMVKILEKNQIESLYLCERKLSNATITVLLNALSNTTQLREVNFEGISMNAHTLYLMSKCIELNWNLKKLNIVTEELKGTEEFYNTIANHEHLQYLQLSGLISCEENVKGIQRVLQTNSTRLVGLKIHDSSFTDHDLSEIMKSLINHRFLEVIEIQSLQSQRFHKTSFQLYEIIKRNKILKQLLVMNLELNGDNIRRIFTALTQNTTLELLYFDQSTLDATDLNEIRLITIDNLFTEVIGKDDSTFFDYNYISNKNEEKRIFNDNLILIIQFSRLLLQFPQRYPLEIIFLILESMNVSLNHSDMNCVAGVLLDRYKIGRLLDICQKSFSPSNFLRGCYKLRYEKN